MINIQEQKAVNAILYFVQNTKGCFKTKLFKLLYFLDFMHFKKHGFSVTGFTYKAFPLGPVPAELLDMMDKNQYPDLYKESMGVVKEESDRSDRDYFIKILPKKKPDLDWFTPNELKVLKQVAEIYEDADTSLIVEATHLLNSPWDKTKKKGMYKEIDIKLALDDETPLTMEEIQERIEIEKLIK